MALLALDDGVGAEQREAVEVLLNRLDRHLPSEHRVALGAVRAELCAVDVRVTIRAILAYVSENRLGMASGAGHFFVHAAKRITRTVMIEFRNCANRGPAGVGVAIFAGDVEGTVRTSTGLPLGIRGAAAKKGQEDEREPTTDLDEA